ncbi:MAG: hypothetical protein LBK63_00175 [Treponema sp.]|jgi:hypothetical protein|nr:hypothetical protein [Treponema sp.]
MPQTQTMPLHDKLQLGVKAIELEKIPQDFASKEGLRLINPWTENSKY